MSEARGVSLEVPVRWGDMDALGHVNNAVYFSFCESARIAYFDAIDLQSHARKPSDGPGLVAANLNFRKQLRYPATARVSANCRRIGGKSFQLDYVIEDAGSGEVAADGSSVCVWVDYEKGAAMPLPEALIDAIVTLEGEPGLRPS